MRRLPLVLLAVLLAAGCSSGNADTSSGAAAVQAPEAAAKDAVGAKPAALTTIARTVVRTASISVSVPDVPSAADRAGALAVRTGGLVQGDTRSREDRGRASLVLRVPTDDVPATLTALSDLGEETARDASEEDVTEQTVDLASRLATQRASVARVRLLLDRAATLSDITALEAELTRREADLESLQNRSTALAGQAAFATITVSLTGQGAKAVVAADPGFLDGLGGGWDALSASARVLALVLGATLPFVPLVLLGVAGRAAWRRRQSAGPAAP